MRTLLAVLLLAAIALAARAVAVHARGSLRPIVLTARAGHVPDGEEKQLCHRLSFPRNKETLVNRVVMKVHGGSHHVHLYRPYGGTVEYPTYECPFAVDFSKWQLVAATQTSFLDWQLPPGVAIDFSPHQPLMIQTHFVNTAALDVRGTAKAKVILHPMDPSAVRAHGGALFGQDKTVVVPPGRHTQVSRCALTGDASAGRSMTLMALTGHYHFRGVEFRVYRVNADGTTGELLYQHEGYDDPSFRIFPPSAPVVLAPGEGLEWWCTWQNDTDTTFKFGPNTSKNEHCNLFGFYYPTETAQEAIDCVHKLDDQGAEVNVRILAQ